jgi:hypothetical protein
MLFEGDLLDHAASAMLATLDLRQYRVEVLPLRAAADDIA